jgi:hypothetical protein
MTPIRLLQAYRFVFACLILIASIETMVKEHGAVFLAAIEIAGVLLFAWRRTQIAGAVVLVAVFTLAEALTIAHGQWPVHLLQYTAAAVFIVLLDRSVRASG